MTDDMTAPIIVSRCVTCGAEARSMRGHRGGCGDYGRCAGRGRAILRDFGFTCTRYLLTVAPGTTYTVRSPLGANWTARSATAAWNLAARSALPTLLAARAALPTLFPATTTP